MPFGDMISENKERVHISSSVVGDMPVTVTWQTATRAETAEMNAILAQIACLRGGSLREWLPRFSNVTCDGQRNRYEVSS